MRQRLARSVRQHLDGPVLADRVGLGQVAGDYGGAGPVLPQQARGAAVQPPALRAGHGGQHRLAHQRVYEGEGPPAPQEAGPGQLVRRDGRLVEGQAGEPRGAGDLRIGIEDGGGPGQGLCRRREPV